MTEVKLTKNFRSGADKEIFSTVNSNQYAMTINPESMGHIISRLTDLYRDPIVATVREIVSNAIDATMQLPENERKPIQISCPTYLSREFTVTDYALGLSFDEIKNIYTRYGTSTKGEDFSQVGAYGLGSKAPLSYTSSFQVRSVKDNELTEILISMEDNKNMVKILTQRATNEPNSMQVKIPVAEDDVSSFILATKTYAQHPIDGIEINGIVGEDEITETYHYFKTVDFNGIPLKLSYKKNNIRDLIQNIRTLINNDDTYSLSGVLAGFEYELITTNRWNQSMEFSVELIPGLVDFSSSRDEITNNARKDNLIQCLQTYISENIKNGTLIEDIIKSLTKNTDNIRHQLLRSFINDYYSSQLELNTNTDLIFTLSNGYNIFKSKLRPITVINGANDVPEHNNLGKNRSVTKGNITRLNQTLENYFNPDDYIAKMNDENSEEYDYNSKSVEDVKYDSSFQLHSLFYMGVPDSVVVVSDVSSLKQAKQVLRSRSNFIQTANDIFVVTDANKLDIENEINQLMLEVEAHPIEIEYYTATEALKIVSDVRKKALKNKTSKKDIIVHPSSHQLLLEDPESLLFVENASVFSSPNICHTVNGDEDEGLIHIGLIVPEDRAFVRNDIYAAVIPYVLALENVDKYVVNIYSTNELFLANKEAIEQDNDYLLLTAYESKIRSKQLLTFIKEKELPKQTNINLDEYKDERIRKALMAYFIIQNVPADYSFILFDIYEAFATLEDVLPYNVEDISRYTNHEQMKDFTIYSTDKDALKIISLIHQYDGFAAQHVNHQAYGYHNFSDYLMRYALKDILKIQE